VNLLFIEDILAGIFYGAASWVGIDVAMDLVRGELSSFSLPYSGERFLNTGLV
jgi:hypothetical protein